MIGFEGFVQATRSITPYPWQCRLADTLADGEPDAIPAWITAPTGAGKTTAVDAAVWALAAQADREPSRRTIGVRLIWVIDRRLLVDEVFAHAESLAATLSTAVRDGRHELHEVAARLLALAADGRWTPEFDAPAALDAGFVPLEAVRWRGGARPMLDRRSPFQPSVITSTVQQVGSRLLFRGYGVGRRSRALEAALVARDAIAFLDEAHLARPFAETVAAVGAFQRDQPQESIPLPPALRLITLTATPPADSSGVVLGLSEQDLANETLRKRLDAAKVLRTLESSSKPVEQLVELAQQALASGDHAESPIVAVVANRVRTALDVHMRLAKAFAPAADGGPYLALLIGPQRPSDRRAELAAIRGPLFEGAAADRPIVVVATQTFEVGLDADVSHLITQSASVSAIVQRIGRVNRAARRAHGSVKVVRDEGFPLYDDDEPAAWDWLCAIEAEGGDVSVGALRTRALPEQSPLPGAPRLTDSIVQQLAQTSIDLPPLQEPDVDGLLRGVHEPIARDVTVAWRADLTGPVGSASGGADAYRRALLRLAPPLPDETVALPIATARRLLVGQAPDRRVLDAPDVPGAIPDAQPDDSLPVVPFVVLRGREVLVGRAAGEPERIDTITPGGLRPGDTLVMALGGRTRGAGPPMGPPDSECHVEFDSELADTVPFVRITPGALGVPTDSAEWRRVAGKIVEKISPTDKAPERGRGARSGSSWADLVLGALGESVERNWEPNELRAVLGADAWVARPLDVFGAFDDGEHPAALHESRGSSPLGWVLRRVSAAVDGEERLRTDGTEPPTLDAHSRAVGERSAAWAGALGTSATVRDAVGLAAHAHDLGKADPRMQAYFAGGVRRIGRKPLAKSEFGTADPVRESVARQRSGLPRGLRHELASVAALASALDSEQVPAAFAAADADVALHLVGTHHGWGRPEFPWPESGAPPSPFVARAADVEGQAVGDGFDGWQDGEWDERFWRLHDRFGPWTVAYLEALVVLADRTISKEGR